MSEFFALLRGWPVVTAFVVSAAMIFGSTVDEIDAPDWLVEVLSSFWSSPEKDDGDLGQLPNEPKAAPGIPFAPVPGRDDRTPVALLNQVFELGNPSLPAHLTGIGPVFWDHAGHGSGTLIAPSIVLTTAHLFAEQGLWDGPLGRTERPPPPSDGRIYLEACGRAYDFVAIDLGSMAPRSRLGLDYAIAELVEPACTAAHPLPVALTPDDLVGATNQYLLSVGAYRFTDVEWYAGHPLYADRDVGDRFSRMAVFGVRCEATGREDTGDVAMRSTAIITTDGCDAVPGGSGGALLVSRDGGASYAVIGVTNSYRPNTDYNNYTRIEGAFAAHLGGYVDLVQLPAASGTTSTPSSLPPGADAPWLSLVWNQEDLR